MKRFLLLLLLLAACQPVQKENSNSITLLTVLDEFSNLDKELNTSWREEQIPDNMIEMSAVEPWTAKVLFLKDRIAGRNDTLLLNLVDARIEMLRSQVAYHLMLQVGENGVVNTAIRNDTGVVLEEINCDYATEIAEFNRFYYLSYTYYVNFIKFMDALLQDSLEARQKLADSSRPAFYDSELGNADKRVAAIGDALVEKCSVTQG
ncbi:MAG TPA: hypothetical protein VI612_02300 [Candidatus Nanoarchaeia archaeon]|nr:hypothetical protein [Candidatus Nanoarchaeia archaeon]